MQNINWRRILLVAGGAVAASVAAAVPAGAGVDVPGLGHLGAGSALLALSAYLGGWATRTPGHGPTDDGPAK